VRVSCATDSSVSGESAAFTIADTGSLRVNSTPAGATIWIDGVNRGMTNKTVTGVPAGQRTLKLTKERFADWQQTVTINRSQTTTVNATMTAGAFTEDFNDNQAQFWTKGEGQATWIAANQVFKCKQGGNSRNTNYYSAGKFSNNITFKVKSMIDKGSSQRAMGVAFGGSNGFTSFYYLDFIPGAKQWSVWKIVDVHNIYYLKAWASSSAINNTGWNTSEVKINGKVVTFFMNGTQIGQMTINDLPESGYVGLAAWTSSNIDEIHFDDASVTIGTGAAASVAGRTEVAVPVRANRWDADSGRK